MRGVIVVIFVIVVSSLLCVLEYVNTVGRALVSIC